MLWWIAHRRWNHCHCHKDCNRFHIVGWIDAPAKPLGGTPQPNSRPPSAK